MVSNSKLVASNSKIIQKFIKVEKSEKKQQLFELLEKELQESQKLYFFFFKFLAKTLRRTLVFVATKRDADLVPLFLISKGIKAGTING